MRIDFLQKIRNKFDRNSNYYSKKTLDKHKKYLASFNVPTTLLQRSYYQFLCQEFVSNNCLLSAIDNVIAHLLFKKYLKKFLIADESKEENSQQKGTLRKVAVFFNPLGEKIIPQELKDEYQIIDIKSFSDNKLSKSDLNFIDNYVQKHPKEHFFNFKIMCRIARYRAIIEKYHPVAIISTCEYSFTSSMLTQFCRENGVYHINIMHGEKLFDIGTTFFEFDKFYVWDEHYINLLIKLRAECSQFLVSIPESLKIDSTNCKKIVDYKFYLEIETKKKLKKLKSIIMLLEQQGKRVVIRPHPLYINKKLLKKYFSEAIIEDNVKVSICESLRQTNFVVARFSTVLYQAYCSHMSVLIDDITDPKIFASLKIADYILLNKGISLLSEHINEK